MCSTVPDYLWPMDCSPPGSSVHGIFQARILECVAISCSRGSSRHRDWTHVYCIFHVSLMGCLGSSLLTGGHFKFLLEVDELLSNRLIAKTKSDLGSGRFVMGNQTGKTVCRHADRVSAGVRDWLHRKSKVMVLEVICRHFCLHLSYHHFFYSYPKIISTDY